MNDAAISFGQLLEYAYNNKNISGDVPLKKDVF